jgi:hypothetical protein
MGQKIIVAHSPLAPASGEREGPAAKRWEGEGANVTP